MRLFSALSFFIFIFYTEWRTYREIPIARKSNWENTNHCHAWKRPKLTSSRDLNGPIGQLRFIRTRSHSEINLVSLSIISSALELCCYFLGLSQAPVCNWHFMSKKPFIYFHRMTHFSLSWLIGYWFLIFLFPTYALSHWIPSLPELSLFLIVEIFPSIFSSPFFLLEIPNNTTQQGRMDCPWKNLASFCCNSSPLKG